MQKVARWIGLWWGLMSAVTWASPAQQALEDARAAQERLDFQTARDRALAGLSSGTATPGEVVELQARVAQTEAALGHFEQAFRAFQVVRLLAPDFALPPGASPRVREPFERAGASLHGARLMLDVQSRGARPGTVEVHVEARGDVLGLVQGARLFVAEGGAYAARPLSGPLPVTATFGCEQEPCAHFVEGVDGFGNPLVRAGSPDAARVVPGFARRDTKPRPWVRTGTVLAAVSMVGAVTAVVFGLGYAAKDRTLSQTPRAQLTYDEARTLDDARRLDYTLMWSGVGTAVAAGGLAVLTW